MIEALPMAAKHDKFLRRLLIIPRTHYKLNFCMTKKASLLLLMQHRFIFQESKTRITSSTFPDGPRHICTGYTGSASD